MKMIWQIDFLILSLIVICGVFAIMIKDLLGAAVVFGAYSFLMCLLWTEMGAVDVAFTEAAVGAGVSTVLFFAAVHRTSRQVKSRVSGRMLYKGIGLLASGLLGGVLFYASSDFPDWADPTSPASTHLSPHFITKTLEETSVPNIVTSVLADYRGFDTMFETAVVLAAGLAVLIILRLGGCRTVGPVREKAAAIKASYEDSIIRFVARQIAPFMQLFALYVIAHGHHSPGGGFQGGVILGASFILLAISYDLKMVMGRINEKASLLLANTGILIYSGIGFLCMLLGANFLDYSILHRILPATDEITARSHAMLGIEIGVALTVMVIVMVIFNNIASNGTYEKGV
jgi:multicomponent Na+:H+ antiporter subunit B